MKFRWHKGGFKESMDTLIEGSSDDINKAIQNKWPGEVTSKYTCVDKRADWGDTYLILVGGVPVGYSDAEL